MDSGKKEALDKAHWRPAKNCGTCVWSAFAPGQYWGVCEEPTNRYMHNKHQSMRELPANRVAVCDKWQAASEMHTEIVSWLKSPLTS